MEISSQAEMDDLGEHLSFRGQRQQGSGVAVLSIICDRHWTHLKSTGSSCTRVAPCPCTHKELPAHQERPGSVSWILEAQ